MYARRLLEHLLHGDNVLQLKLLLRRMQKKVISKLYKAISLWTRIMYDYNRVYLPFWLHRPLGDSGAVARVGYITKVVDTRR